MLKWHEHLLKRYEHLLINLLIKVQRFSKTDHFWIVSGMSCKFCGKVFNRCFNLRRHERENCTLKDRRSQEMDFEDNFSTSSIDSESESLMATDNEGESEE